MNIIHYLKQCTTWFGTTPIARFIVRLTVFCCALLVYTVVMSFMLILLISLSLYKLSVGLIPSNQRRDFGNVERCNDKASEHVTEHELPALPKW